MGAELPPFVSRYERVGRCRPLGPVGHFPLSSTLAPPQMEQAASKFMEEYTAGLPVVRVVTCAHDMPSRSEKNNPDGGRKGLWACGRCGEQWKCAS